MRKLFVLAAALILAALPLPAAATPADDTPTATPIKHVVWIMQDNHSFDNYFGTYPGADGIPQGVCQRVNLNRRSTVGCVQPFRLGDTPVEDLGQGPGIQRRQYNNGQMDGFVAAYRRLGQDGTSAMGYYDGSDIPFHWNTADQYVLFDRFFSSTTVGYREAYLYWLAGRAPAGPTPLDSSAGYDALPTVFDRLAERQISARFYVENLDRAATSADQAGVTRFSQLVKVPLLGMKRFRDGGDLAGQVVDLSEYYNDLRDGTLPAVSYIVTTGSSENPPAAPAAGSRTLHKITGELMRSSAWSTSALMWSYDGWGGWYDHVPPPRVDSHGYGFRVPALLVSPYAKRGVVDHTVLDYTAMLKFIESNWQLAPLSTRDQQSAGLVSAFDFSAPARSPVLPALTRAGAQESLSTENPAPVIYGVYGLAAALAITVLSLASRARPVTVPAPVGRAGVLVRSWFEPLLRQPFRGLHATQTRGGPARRSAHFYDWSRATLAVQRWPRPAVATEGEEAWAGWSPEITRIPAGRGLVSVVPGGIRRPGSAVDPAAGDTEEIAEGKELAEGGPNDGAEDYRTRVEEAQLPDDVRKAALREVGKLERTSAQSPESHDIRIWLETILDLAWSAKITDSIDIHRSREVEATLRRLIEPAVGDIDKDDTADARPAVADIDEHDAAETRPAAANMDEHDTAETRPAAANMDERNTAETRPAAANMDERNTAEAKPAAADIERADAAPFGPHQDDTVKLPAGLAAFSGGGQPRPQLGEQKVFGPVVIQTPADKRHFAYLVVAATALAALLIGALLLFAASRDRGVPTQSVPSVRATAAATVSRPTSEPPQEPTETARKEAAIQLEDVAYSATPFQTVRIEGTYRSGPNTFVRVQRWEGGKWLDFPLPTKTDQSGKLTAYVELAQPGPHRLRVLDPHSHATSKTFVLTIKG